MDDELGELEHDETADVAEIQPTRFASDLGLPTGNEQQLKDAAAAVRQEFRDSSRWKRLNCKKVSVFAERDRGTVYVVHVGNLVANGLYVAMTRARRNKFLRLLFTAPFIRPGGRNPWSIREFALSVLDSADRLSWIESTLCSTSSSVGIKSRTLLIWEEGNHNASSKPRSSGRNG